MTIDRAALRRLAETSADQTLDWHRKDHAFSDLRVALDDATVLALLDALDAWEKRYDEAFQTVARMETEHEARETALRALDALVLTAEALLRDIERLNRDEDTEFIDLHRRVIHRAIRAAFGASDVG